MRAFLLIAAFCGMAGAACSPIPGAEQLWARPGLRYIVLGEMHGSAETPMIFGDLVCAAQAAKRKVVAAIEHPTTEQPVLDAFLRDEDHEAALKGLLAHSGWHSNDGRSSQAMLALLESLRAMKVDVLAFDLGAGQPAAERNRSMAAALEVAAKLHPDALLIVLTGNIHGSKKLFGGYPPMAMILPAAETVSLLVIDRGGQVWASIDGTYGPHDLKSSGGEERGVDLTPARSRMGGYDGVISTGVASTGSPPAVKDTLAPKQ